MATIVSDERYGVPHRAGGDPEVIIADEPMRATWGLQAALEPPIGLANLEIVRDNSSRVQTDLELADLRRSPLPSLGPIIKLAHGHERNHDGAVLNVRPVKVGSRIIRTQEVREDIGIEEDFLHVAPG